MLTLPENSKIWMYLSNKKIEGDTLTKVNNSLAEFVADWKAHGTDLDAHFKILYGNLIVVWVDETSYGASGCSIDKLLQKIKTIEQDNNIVLLDRLQVGLVLGDSIEVSKPTLLKNLSYVNPETKIVDITISTGTAFNSNLFIPIKGSWVERYLA